MSIVNIVEKAFACLLSLLYRESLRHQRKLEHFNDKAHNHRNKELSAIQKMQEAGRSYRTSLYKEADKHGVAMDKADALAAKIRKVIE